MANRNLCSGCGFNFATMETFEKHRVGEFGKDRRCLTLQEMKDREWEYTEPSITFYKNGVPYKKNTPTWKLPIWQSRAKSLLADSNLAENSV